VGNPESNPATAGEISRSFHAGGSRPFTGGDRPPDEPPPDFAIRGAFTKEEIMNPQTSFPTWSTRLAVTAVAAGIAMVAAAAIANVPRPNAPFDYGTASHYGSVITDEDANRKAFAAASNGSQVTGYEFERGLIMSDDELGPLSETSNPEILD
jgi:hypothetical protein